MGGIFRQHHATALTINGVDDHVHILASMPTTIALADFMRELKSVSSGWVSDERLSQGPFAWQTGYAAFSVSKSGGIGPQLHRDAGGTPSAYDVSGGVPGVLAAP
jgi:REP element-mobilizing transposase RayT